MSEEIRWAEMTPEQRNALVAERVMGLSVTHLTEKEYRFTNEENEEEVHQLLTGYVVEGKFGSELVRPYTTNMDAAWQVVEKFKQDGRGGYEFIQWQYHLGKLYNRPSYRDTLYDLNPEGVCIAGLRAVGVEIESSAGPARDHQATLPVDSVARMDESANSDSRKD